MPRALTSAAALALVLALSLGAVSGELPIVQSLTPAPPSKMPENITLEGRVYHMRSQTVDVQVEAFLLPEVGPWFEGRGLKNPFFDIPMAMNYILVRVRFENLSATETLEFVPTASAFDSCLAKDEAKIFETFYVLSEGEARLAVLGKSLYLKPLMLPPGQWIERLILFEYDEPFPVKRMTFSLSGVGMGRDRIDMAFPYRAGYGKKPKEKK